MKKLIVTACVAIVSVVAIADAVQSSNTFGVLKVSTGKAVNEDANNRSQFFIGVPWESVGGSAISPESLVLASNLNSGDAMFVYGAVSGEANVNKCGAWSVSGGAWTPLNVNLDEYTTISAANAENVTVPRTSGLIVWTAKDAIYLSGQYNSGNTLTLSSGVTTLISAPKVDSDYNLVTVVGANAASGDTIYLDATTCYVYANDAWHNDANTTYSYGQPPAYGDPISTITLPRGYCAWYYRAGGNVTLTFN